MNFFSLVILAICIQLSCAGKKSKGHTIILGGHHKSGSTKIVPIHVPVCKHVVVKKLVP